MNADLWRCIRVYLRSSAVNILRKFMNYAIDVGLSSLLRLNNDDNIEPPEFLRASEKKLTRRQKRLSRKKKRSNKRKKQVRIVARTHRTIRNQRKDFAGKIVELVNPRNTSQNCSGCHNPVPKNLSVRVHSCPFCGLVLDRAIESINR
jgi:putative transposase